MADELVGAVTAMRPEDVPPDGYVLTVRGEFFGDQEIMPCIKVQYREAKER